MALFRNPPSKAGRFKGIMKAVFFKWLPTWVKKTERGGGGGGERFLKRTNMEHVHQPSTVKEESLAKYRTSGCLTHSMRSIGQEGATRLTGGTALLRLFALNQHWPIQALLKTEPWPTQLAVLQRRGSYSWCSISVRVEPVAANL